MKYTYAVILFLTALLLQTTLLNLIGLFGVTPNLILCLVIIFSFLFDEGYYGVALGVPFGLLYDICFSEYVGLAAIGFFVIAFSIMIVNFVMNKETVLSVILITIGATFLYQSIYWVIMAMLGSHYSYGYMLQYMPLNILYNTVITSILYYALINKVTKHHKDRYYK